MFNINVLSPSPEIYTTSLNNHAKPSGNQITTNIRSIQNTLLSEPITIRNLPHIVVDEIGKYLDIKNIQNLNKADVCWKIDPVSNQIRKYSNQIKKLRQWENECSKETEENRKLAVMKIIDCIKKEDAVLNLNYLNLTRLPDLRSFEFITRLCYRGNNYQPIVDCFEQPKYNLLPFSPPTEEQIYHLIPPKKSSSFCHNKQCYELKQSSLLPKNITTIAFDEPNIFGYGYEAGSEEDAMVCFIRHCRTDDKSCDSVFFRHILSVYYYEEENFEEDFLLLYRL